MLRHIKRKPEYWAKHKPKSIGENKLTTDTWKHLVSVLTRFKKPVSFDRLEKFLEQKGEHQLYKNLIGFRDDKNSIPAIKEHTTHMIYIYDQEKKRQESLDNKAKQIITNVSLLFSVIAFSSAIILNKDNYVLNYTEASIFFVLVGLILALTSLVISVFCLDVKAYNRPKQEVVFDPLYRNEEPFLKQKITDFFFCLYINTKTNTKKSIRIKRANWLFIAALFFVGAFTIINILAIIKRNNKKVETEAMEIKIIDNVPVTLTIKIDTAK